MHANSSVKFLKKKESKRRKRHSSFFFVFLEIEFNIVCQLVHIDVADYHLDSTLNIDCS